MDMNEFSRANLKRNNEGFEHPLEEWSIAEWTNALCGEAGEAANFAKKIIRLRSKVAKLNKQKDMDREVLIEKLAGELSDVVIYADLCFQAIGRNMADEVKKTFNSKSIEVGLTDHIIP